eukprot:TRINITY_DN7791_c0_g1_i1.p1 TRINITY_DN7791_c0_g1~~TRINITY_DN7791_c0_g1_i1.p1  ORF type:complete len:761 (+),score=178.56 TRINITY_DN7791_c0_g1_i1:41-2323(+)
MSRHKNVRNMMYEDYTEDAYDEQYEDDYYDQDGADEWGADGYYEDPAPQPAVAEAKTTRQPTPAILSSVLPVGGSVSQSSAPANKPAIPEGVINRCVDEILELLHSGSLYSGPVEMNIEEIHSFAVRAEGNVEVAMGLIMDHFEADANHQSASQAHEPSLIFNHHQEDDQRRNPSNTSKVSDILAPSFNNSQSAVDQITFSMRDLHLSDLKDSDVVPFDFSSQSPDDQIRKAKTLDRIKSQPPAASGPAPTKGQAQSSAAPSLTKRNSQGSLSATPKATAKEAFEEKKTMNGPINNDNFKLSQKELTKLAKQKSELVELEKKKRSDAKQLISVVIAGHVDAGKSTMMGHLLYLKGEVDKKSMHKFEKESKEIGKGSFKFAWVMDAHESERARGITVDVAVKYFETATKIVTILDAPGHQDFVPNMISGASQADFAILVVDSTPGGFERGFQDNGQTKEHAFLLSGLGVSKVILAVNKLDTDNWNKERFDEIVSSLKKYMKSIGFKDKDLHAVPCSGLTGENILEAKSAELRSWYEGDSLVGMIDKFEAPSRAVDNEFRFSVSDVFKSQTPGVEITAGGKIESGSIIAGEPVKIMPPGISAVVKSIFNQGEAVKIAMAGDNVELNLVSLGEAVNVVSVGQTICSFSSPIHATRMFTVKIAVLNPEVPIHKGSQVVVHANSTDVSATFVQLIALVNKSDGSILKKKPRVLPAGSHAEVQIRVNDDQPAICLERFKDFKTFGRVLIREDGRTIAAGRVLSIDN